MSASESQSPTPRQAEPQLVGGKVPPAYHIERLYDPAVIAEIMYRAQNLSDEAFEDLIDDVGYRASRLVLRAEAVRGNVKAIELYDKIVQRTRKERDDRRKPAERVVNTGSFVQPPRSVTDKGEDEGTP